MTEIKCTTWMDCYKDQRWLKYGAAIEDWVYKVTLLYEMASNSSLICAGFWMSSSLEERGWEEARASTANTLWTSLSTMRSFYYKTYQTLRPKLPWSVATLFRPWGGHRVAMKVLPNSSRVQPRVLPGTQHRRQSLHSATGHSTILRSPDYQTTKGTAKKKEVNLVPSNNWSW